MSITTDHSKATADAAHSHGVGIVPDKSRADRIVSFDVDAFPVPTGREENWRFSAVRDLKPLFVDAPVEGHLEWPTFELPDGATLTELSAA